MIELQQNDELPVSVGLENDNNMFLWNVIFQGSDDTLYEVSVTHVSGIDDIFVSRAAPSRHS